MSDITDLIRLYTDYGFNYREELSNKEDTVFTITQGVFDNAIIIKNNTSKCSKLEDDLTDLGFHVNTENFTCIKDLEKKLFRGFFSLRRTKLLFSTDYENHIKNITKSFPTSDISYKYIHSSYHKNGNYYDNQRDIIGDIQSEINTHGPKLLLIEAPAGFGKTCTAYEIGKIISEQDDDHLVLFAELSRDRHAKIFNHVIQRELARSFPAVSASLVNKEIKTGKIVVILDGFDELLNDREEEKFQFEKSQAMLETIGKMLEVNAKIILTTRKTAILQGDDFDEWISENANKFEFMRYTLKEPSARSWLSNDRASKLAEYNVNIKNLSNPVLLTFLKFIPDEEFYDVIKRPDNIVDKYFNLILKREIERQTLKLDVAEQSALLTRLAKDMVLNNYTKASKESIIDYISYQELELIEKCRSRYEHEFRPTFEEMIEKLSNHALLDRTGFEEKIGFVNNFVLGHFVGIDLLETDEEWLADSIFIDAVVNSFSSRTKHKRIEVWRRLSDSLIFLNDDEKVRFEQTLLEQVSGNYQDSQFKEITFETRGLFKNGSASSCLFYECTFNNCLIDFDRLKNNSFISCSFYNCDVSGINTSNNIISPTFDYLSSQALAPSIKETAPGVKTLYLDNEDDQLKVFVLEKFWPVGRETIAYAHRPLFIFYRSSNHPVSDITKTIDELRKEGLIISAKRKNWIGLDFSGQKMQLIKDILGR